MSRRTSPWPPGIPCWVDISVPDVPAASAFYSAVLGWHVEEPDEQYGGYVIASADGSPAAGIGPQQQPDAPAAWTMYVSSTDADATADAISAAGGQVLVPAMDVGPLGRMLVAADPSGAVFGIWQAGTYIGSSIVNEPGGLTWEDLRSSDPDAARAFYASVFGYSYDPVPMAGDDYRTFAPAEGEPPLGGMGGMMGIEGMPSHWLVYFGVADTDAAVAAAEAGGGTALMPAFDTPYGRMSVLADPFGAAFSVIEAGDRPQPDRGD